MDAGVALDQTQLLMKYFLLTRNFTSLEGQQEEEGDLIINQKSSTNMKSQTPLSATSTNPLTGQSPKPINIGSADTADISANCSNASPHSEDSDSDSELRTQVRTVNILSEFNLL